MTYRDQQQGNRSWRSDQDRNQNRNRSNQNREESFGYNQAANRSRADFRGMERQDDYNRMNYMPDNDENRYDNDRDYEDTQYGTSGTYGYRGNYNSGNAGYGGMSGNSGYNSGMNSGVNSGSSYGRQNWQGENQGMGNMGTDSGRYNRNYGNEGGYENNWSRERRGYDARMGEGNNYQQQRMNRDDRGWWDKTRDEVQSWFGDDEAERRRNMDRMYQESHKGKGPRNYQRSQERIKEDVCDRLTDDDMLDATDIDIEVRGDEVILTGYVNNRMQKRRAEDLAEAVSGVHNVENRIHVGQRKYDLVDEGQGTSSLLTRDDEEQSKIQ
jgi:osmotically-inducible protein OsmY